jgi:hypothetical protein
MKQSLSGGESKQILAGLDYFFLIENVKNPLYEAGKGFFKLVRLALLDKINTGNFSLSLGAVRRLINIEEFMGLLSDPSVSNDVKLKIKYFLEVYGWSSRLENHRQSRCFYEHIAFITANLKLGIDQLIKDEQS